MVAETVEDLSARYGPAYKWLVTIAGLTGAFAMVLSSTIGNVAVPNVMGAFGIGQDEAQWIATAYLAPMTASQLINAWMVGAFGQRIAFLLTLVVFSVGALLAAAATSIDVLILGRVLQGAAAGVIQPLVMVTIFQVFPAERRGLAMGIYGTGVTLAPGIGPAFGGLTIDLLSWRHVFLMPLPFVAVALLLGSVFMPTASRRGPLPRFDWTGYILLCGSLFLLMTAVANGSRDGWLSDRIVLMFVGGLALGAGFVISQLRGTAPILDFTLFRHGPFAAATCVAFVFGLGNFASSYVIPVFVQAVQGYTATRAGMVLMPAGLALVLTLPITGRMADRLPDHVPVMIGLGCFALGMALMAAADVDTAFWTFALYTVIGRLGMAFILPSLNATALRVLPSEQLNKASGNLNFIRQLGGAAGTNLIVVWLQLRTSFHADLLATTQTAANATSQVFIGRVEGQLDSAGIPPALQYPLALDYLGKVVYAQAETIGFQDSFLILAAVFVLALLPAWVLGRAVRAAR